MKSYLLPLLLFLSGIVIGDIWFRAGLFLVFIVVLVLLVFQRFRSAWLGIICLFVGYLLAVLSLTHAVHERERVGDMVAWGAYTQSISGVAQEMMSTSEFAHRYRVIVSEIAEKSVIPFDVSLILPPNLSLTPGDRFRAVGKFSFPRDTEDYNAEKQLWYRGMVAEFRTFQTTKTPPETYSIFVRARQWFDGQLSLIFPPRGYDILSGIILGQKNTFDTTFREQLKASGLMHIMVVSGSNVMMLIIFLSLFLRGFLPWIRIVMVTGVILSFVFLVGGEAPVWRAALMGVLGYSASLW
jgi:predicted membrane metal-binding protein